MFEQEFQDEFFPQNPAKTAALVLQDRDQYGQGKCLLDKYIDSFRALVEQAGYPDGLQLCLTFREGLQSTLMERIDNLAEGRPADNQVNSWYRVAWDQWQLMELKRSLRQAPAAAIAPRPLVSFPRPGAAVFHPPSLPAPSAVPTLPPGAPMDVDSSCQRANIPLLCRCCGTPGHFARCCPLGLEVRYLALEEQEELLLQLLVAKDAAGATSPGVVALETLEQERSVDALGEGSLEDF